ncbi:cell wall-active antibiotic response 4TMS protein YvqF [Paenibacillus cellulosilyticus]|uniref:Cell wall-active antibiotic response 4TMS protein YvqF n=1 Tax=Paenibacillus cellulosilyticus TaxID=375489 RepID=A0A2V2YPC5_9BACL|nr:cell wall-active antibiotics response protein LiaF [Paenibacillus cellulosilyticus]PWV97837.1 cell wall-active antibiotic response 4TMS protein YvqF [Paenibacillus cellulosilyticus]
MNRHYASRILWGLFIVAIGAGFLLNQLGIVSLDIGDIVSTFWPVILIVAGLNNLLTARHGGNAFGACVLITVGFIFLGRSLDWFDWSIGDMIRFIGPVVLILFGLNMVFRPRGSSKHRHQNHEHRDDWQAYRPGGYVPPAPPLHPDPTAASGDSANHAEPPAAPMQPPVPPTPPFRPNLSKHEQHIEMKHQMRREKLEERREKLQMRRDRIEEKIQRHRQHSNPWERVEWWENDPSVQNRSGFIGDIHIGHDHWELKPLNISHFIGDTVIDLTKAHIPFGETRITISSFIGDVKIYLPNDYEVGIHVVSSAFIGDARVLDMRDSRLFRSMDVETPAYKDTDKKIKLVCSTFIGDVRVTKVG